MDMGGMKNIVVLKNLPSNLVEEAIVVLKQNKKVRKFQYIESEIKKSDDKDSSNYIVKEAESVINQYITNLETKSPKWKNNIQKLEKKYKKSLKINLILGVIAIVCFLINIIK